MLFAQQQLACLLHVLLYREGGYPSDGRAGINSLWTVMHPIPEHRSSGETLQSLAVHCTAAVHTHSPLCVTAHASYLSWYPVLD